MPLQSPPQSISLYDGAQEAYKTSWVNTNYPNLPNPNYKLDPHFFSSRNVDTRGQVGFNPDGTWSVAKLYNWDTWKRPEIKWVHSYQLTITGGLLVAFYVENGDIWRSGYVIRINEATTTFPSNLGNSEDWVHFGPEHNSGTSDLQLKFSKFHGANDRNVQVITDQAFRPDIDRFGGFTVSTDDDPNPIWFPDLTDTQTYMVPDMDGVTFAVAYPSFQPTTSEIYAISVASIDGRQYHTLSAPDDINGFNTSNNPISGTDYQNFQSTPLVQNTPGQLMLDNDDGDGIIRIFNGIGDPIISNIGTTSFQFELENKYLAFIQPDTATWVYVTDDTQNLEHPYFPDNEANYNFSGTYQDPGFDKWVLYQGFTSTIENLTQNTSYHVWFAPFVSGDIDRYDTLSGDVSAPDETNADIFEPPLESPLVVQTGTEVVAGITLNSISISEFYTSGIYMNFTYTGDMLNTSFQAEILYQESQTEPSTFDPNWGDIDGQTLYPSSGWQDTVNLESGNTNNPKEGVATVSMVMTENDWFRVRVRAIVNGTPGSWSDFQIVEYVL